MLWTFKKGIFFFSLYDEFVAFFGIFVMLHDPNHGQLNDATMSFGCGINSNNQPSASVRDPLFEVLSSVFSPNS